jgi:hypothetical protein
MPRLHTGAHMIKRVGLEASKAQPVFAVQRGESPARSLSRLGRYLSIRIVSFVFAYVSFPAGESNSALAPT